MKIINITCSNCNVISRTKVLEVYHNKTINVPCHQCGTKNKIFVPEPKSVELSRKTENSSVSKLASKVSARILIPESMDIKRQSFIIRDGENIIGRKSSQYDIEAPIICSDRYMSRKHCLIHSKLNPVTNQKFYTIKEIDSKNKIILNDKLMENDEEMVLNNGDKIILGTTLIHFETNVK
ncbi:MAG: FHA domain-containing protein [Saprospiraceae bacterium]